MPCADAPMPSSVKASRELSNGSDEPYQVQRWRPPTAPHRPRRSHDDRKRFGFAPLSTACRVHAAMHRNPTKSDDKPKSQTTLRGAPVTHTALYSHLRDAIPDLPLP
jgi:hypothetical protein